MLTALQQLQQDIITDFAQLLSSMCVFLGVSLLWHRYPDQSGQPAGDKQSYIRGDLCLSLPGLPVSALHGPAAASPPVRCDGARLRRRGDQHPLPPAEAPQWCCCRCKSCAYKIFHFNFRYCGLKFNLTFFLYVFCVCRWTKLVSRSRTRRSGRSWAWRRRTCVSPTTWLNTWRRTGMTFSWTGRAGRAETSGSEPSSPSTSTPYCPLRYSKVGRLRLSPAVSLFHVFIRRLFYLLAHL